MKNVFFATICVTLFSVMIACNSTGKGTKQPDGTSDTKAVFNTGVYKGIIPVGNSKQQVSITFQSDSSFTLSEAFVGSTDPAMSSTGTWKYDPQSGKIILVYKNLADRVTTFAIIDNKTIQIHSGSAWTESTKGTEYNLTRE